MESRFAHLRQRDTSVSMLRVKMSRRRSQSQKENRERTLNTRRQLDKLPELEMSSLDASVAMTNISTIQDKTQNNAKPAKTKAVEERIKQLERWKERKALEKEKEKRERDRKGVFKIGLYHPKGTIASLPAVPDASTRVKEKKVNTAPSQSARVTRSMKQQQQVQKPLKMQDPNTGVKKVQPAVERSTRTRVASVKPTSTTAKTKEVPAVRALPTRSANRPPGPAVKDKPKDNTAASDIRTTRSRANLNPVAPLSGGQRNCKAAVNNTIHHTVPEKPELTEPEMQEMEKKPSPPSPTRCSEEEEMVVDHAPAQSVPTEPASSSSSFAPEGFVFQAPTGLSSFKFEPLTPRSADAFLTPSSSFNLPPAPVFGDEQSESSPPKSPLRTSPTVVPPTPGEAVETKHDVPYFRSEIANETHRLTTLCLHWESKVEDESIPEEMRDRMRTAVGQARLLMKERFNQFSGLVDDCELGRGDKITTCTDLQGFWDMVYYQVEDVNKKFDALKEAEGRSWVEEHKPPQRQKKVVKKPSAVPAKPAGTNAAAKARLAAAKAAMKAKKQAAEAEKAANAADSEGGLVLSSQHPQPQAGAQKQDTVVFDGGFFQVESPAKPSGTIRRSSRLNAAALPCSYLSPRRVTRSSLALTQTPVHSCASPIQPVHTPAHLRHTLKQTTEPKSQCGTPQPTQTRSDTANTSVCFSPVREVISDDAQPDGCPAQQSEKVSTEEDISSVPEFLPAICLVEQDGPAEDINVDRTVSPAIPISPCKTPPAVSQTLEPSSGLSFMLSPCATPNPPSISSPAVQGPVETLCHTQDGTVTEEIPGLDFERYFQPSDRCSLSPRDAAATERLSPMAVDVEMESPRSQPMDLLTQPESAWPPVSSVLTPQSPQVQTVESAMLLFTPDLKDKIRQSVCPSDLMVFTPPNM